MVLIRCHPFVWMVILASTVLPPAFGQASSTSDADPAPQLARQLYEVAMPAEALSAMLAEVFEQLHPAEPEGVWPTLEGRLPFHETALLGHSLQQIYAERLSPEQMREMIAAYSAAGESPPRPAPFEDEVRALAREWMRPLVAELLAERKAQQRELAAGGELSRLVQTAGMLRDVGEALMYWLTDEVTAKKRRFYDSGGLAGESWSVANQDRVYSYRRITHDELVALLVPRYLDEVPEQDAWGHALQFALNRDVLGATVFSLRSPGRDGVYEEGAYEVGPYARDRSDRDLVWADGYFARWPKDVARLLALEAGLEAAEP